MADAWTFEGQPAALGAGTVTLVEGSSFCVSSWNGDIRPGGPQGVYHADTRLLSRWELRVDDAPIEPLQVLAGAPYHATFLGRTQPRPGRAESTLMVVRDRYVGGGLREDLLLRNLSDEPAGCVVDVHIGSDVADLFEVKINRVRHVPDVELVPEGASLRVYSPSRARGAVIRAADALAVPGLLGFRVAVPARGEWRASLQVNPIIDGEESQAWFSTRHPVEHARPAVRLAAWQRHGPCVVTDHPVLAMTLRRSKEDLGSLRLYEPGSPDEPPTIAAGAPWFMTLFGRDSLLTSWMALPLDQSPALGTLRRLARLQGTKIDPLSEEEPGKIPHELRFGARQGVSPHGAACYYGSVDATPLYVVLLGELHRWGIHREAVEELVPHADAALSWIEEYGERAGPIEGLLWYRRKTDKGLVNQGWKDSFDGVNFADGTLARAPIALAEAQGYAYAAYVTRSHFAHEAGDHETERRYLDKASSLRRMFNELFWLPERGCYAIGLDREGRPIDSVASNMGHCLWTGIVDEDKAEYVAWHLLSEEMFTGFGVRTLASSMGAYNPMSYHNGSVWPHDNALIVSGLMRYGFVAEAQRVAMGLLDAAEAFGGRLPELFCGFGRKEFPVPVPYPTSCSPQAWAAASPVQIMRALLRFDPWIPHGRLWVAPVLPEKFGELRITGLPLAGGRVNLVVWSSGETKVSGLPPEIEVRCEPRPSDGTLADHHDRFTGEP
ncbi:amylo-alpha-1,6-glucosidase [Microbispora sp. SCL1-1]|uniref:Amylo-alpha-1,6-glucosidase n=1 Tax=Microbispora hainanensis TaxID=568844 RepID=A0ABZ1SUK9_9ACTN|nr:MULTISPECIES: glycogen debranching N-terminal domain-containing protein [Microbispora]NJP25333.1 amylo-alpha-1,6-glucosidase [Microbispora sp. CL1-1]TQS13779.1 amylo-alpha-1,6-glucosidase [Microbispora sp. SCL1-1]